MRAYYPVIAGVVLALPASAADIAIKVEIPRLAVAEYHRPYVAIWIERPDQSVAANLAVWYDVKLKNNEGTKWLKDMRQWCAGPAMNWRCPTARQADARAGRSAAERRRWPAAAGSAGSRPPARSAAQMLRIASGHPDGRDSAPKGEHELGQLSSPSAPDDPPAHRRPGASPCAFQTRIAAAHITSPCRSRPRPTARLLPSATVLSGRTSGMVDAGPGWHERCGSRPQVRFDDSSAKPRTGDRPPPSTFDVKLTGRHLPAAVVSTGLFKPGRRTARTSAGEDARRSRRGAGTPQAARDPVAEPDGSSRPASRPTPSEADGQGWNWRP
jgi:hypothetical protein